MRGFFNLDSPIMSFLARLCDLFWLNILTLICCIPIFTIGPALTALYYVTMKMVRGEEGYLTKPYLKAFKDNFKKSTIVWLIMCVVGGIIAVDYYVIFFMEVPYRQVILFALAAVSSVLVIGSLYFFPLQARFENTCLGTIKNGYLLSVTQLPRTIMVLIIYAIPIALAYFAPTVLFLYTFVGISMPTYLASFFFVKVFKKIEEMQEQAVEAQIEEA